MDNIELRPKNSFSASWEEKAATRLGIFVRERSR